MYVYIASSAGWTVGFYTPAGDWEPEADCDTKLEAAQRVHWLNGGAREE